MSLKTVPQNIIRYLNDQSIDLRVRMMYFLEYASFIACLIGTVCMFLLNQPIESMIPNLILFAVSFISLYFSHKKKQYKLSILIMITGCANFALPWMFFSAGGNESGMPIWLVFGVVVSCLMLEGRTRIVILTITILEYIACICIGHFFPQMVTPLVGNDAMFYDLIQSFAVVCFCLTIMLGIYITTYNKQHKILEEQSRELRKIMQTDALTGMFNRHAYYDEINTYKDSKDLGNLVLVVMDVNGLKKINDLHGHAAGDEYICTTANVISQALGSYGKIFRTGGDEFTAILHCSPSDAESFENHLKECIAALDNPWYKDMAIAVGIVCCEDNIGLDITEIEKLADKRMYENKSNYYRQNGIDRRR